MCFVNENKMEKMDTQNFVTGGGAKVADDTIRCAQ